MLFVKITLSFLQYSTAAFVNKDIEELKNKMGKAIINAVIYGDGSGKPTGITNGLVAKTDSNPIDLIKAESDFVLGSETVANVPYGSMLSLITEDAGERAELSTWRSIGSMFGNILPTIILPMLIWQKVTYDGTGNYHTNPLTGEAYKMGDPVLDPLTGKQFETLLGNRVFFAALIMGVLGFIAFMVMIKIICMLHCAIIAM